MDQSNNLNNLGGGKGPKMPRFNMNWLYTIIIIALIALFFSGGGDALGGSAAKEATYTEFKQYVDKGYVLSVVANKTESNLKIYINPKYTRDVYKMSAQNVGPNPYVKVQFGSIDEVDRFVNEKVKEGKIHSFSYDNQKDNDFWSLIMSLAPLLLFFFFIYWMSGRMGSGMSNMGGGIFNVGKSKAKMYEKGNAIGITFKDVAGQEGAKQEVQEIVDFLKNPQKYTDLGGKIPKGALLVGPPGTGKTLLAKAVAGEAGVPFFSMSGSDFVEMFVGVGASRVRDLFRQAKEKSPSIIFIDEIDAVGRARSKNPAMGGNDERENTLNALLTEMDGFGTNSGVIILAATNRVDMLDSALLRAGRFDREIHVDLPGLNERKAIFLVHLKPIKIDETVDVDLLARQTPGFSGADIANVCNEAALIAARHNKKAVCKQDFLDAVDRIVGGLEKKTKVMTADEKRSIALHEAGHATISWFCQYANPLIKVTIVPLCLHLLQERQDDVAKGFRLHHRIPGHPCLEPRRKGKRKFHFPGRWYDYPQRPVWSQCFPADPRIEQEGGCFRRNRLFAEHRWSLAGDSCIVNGWLSASHQPLGHYYPSAAHCHLNHQFRSLQQIIELQSRRKGSDIQFAYPRSRSHHLLPLSGRNLLLEVSDSRRIGYCRNLYHQ